MRLPDIGFLAEINRQLTGMSWLIATLLKLSRLEAGVAAIVVLVIMVTSVFCIRNSFAISMTEKMKLYGRLASVGTTAKRQRKIVYYEAILLGAAGIPLGILSGILPSVILVRSGSSMIRTESLPLTKDYRNIFTQEKQGLEKVSVYSLGEETYDQYCQRAEVNETEAREQAIVLAEYELVTFGDQNRKQVQSGDAAHFQPGDLLESQDGEISITRLTQTRVKPLFMNDRVISGVVLIVSDSWMDSHRDVLERNYKSMTDVYLKCDSASKIEEIVRRDLNLINFTIANYEAQYQSDRSMHLLLSVFLYGFITVVALIGITNIFNTITTNMELRAPEFAMLRAIGVTGREFRRMIRLESLFYGGKALLIGIPLGILIAWCFNRAMGKINRKSIVETIRNENL